jgi:exopolyphosphatase/guanosine-5'-triphosphate,3'-diphosphate pyrophosphatase
MDNRYAVMDLGTNTFHLLIVEGNANNFNVLVHEQIAVKLGEGGINKGIILPAPFERGIATLKYFETKINKHNTHNIKCIATSALRNASNGKDFIDRAMHEAGIAIELVDGNSEAAYIYRGIKFAGALSDENSLIMDIGGGSVEFIIGNNERFIWKQSFEIGAARLMERFHHSDPISPASIEALNLYLENTLPPLFDAVKKYPVKRLIGSSGAFETFAGLAAWRRNDSFDIDKVKNYPFDYEELLQVTDEMILSTHAQREANDVIVPVRVDMIVVSSIITRFIMQKLEIKDVALCTYSLKEGVLAEMMRTRP